MKTVFKMSLVSAMLIVCLSAHGQTTDGKSLTERPVNDSLPNRFQLSESIGQKGLAPVLGTDFSLPHSLATPVKTSFKHVSEKRFNIACDIPLYIPWPQQTPAHTPFADDYTTKGTITSWNNGAIVGGSSMQTMPALMSNQSTNIGVMQKYGNLTLSADVNANRYHFMFGNTTTTFGFSGMARYDFNENVSFTIFGHYATNNHFYSMAAMPYMGGKGYGGYLTFMGEALGVDLGVQRVYDVFAQRWTTTPIITPKIRVNDKFTFDLPVGWLVGNLLEKAFKKDKVKPSPMIGPPVLPMPGKIPFGTPEMPH